MKLKFVLLATLVISACSSQPNFKLGQDDAILKHQIRALSTQCDILLKNNEKEAFFKKEYKDMDSFLSEFHIKFIHNDGNPYSKDNVIALAIALLGLANGADTPEKITQFLNSLPNLSPNELYDYDGNMEKLNKRITKKQCIEKYQPASEYIYKIEQMLLSHGIVRNRN